jgi:hypothetical protein
MNSHPESDILTTDTINAGDFDDSGIGPACDDSGVAPSRHDLEIETDTVDTSDADDSGVVFDDPLTEDDFVSDWPRRETVWEAQEEARHF